MPAGAKDRLTRCSAAPSYCASVTLSTKATVFRIRARTSSTVCSVSSCLGGFCPESQAAAAWLSGETPPKHEDNEQTIAEVRARIRKTVAFAESVTEAQYAGAAERKVSLSWAPGKVLGGEDYLLQMTIPNVYFHIVMAYAILRHNGVDIGKMDFLGPIHWIEA